MKASAAHAPSLLYGTLSLERLAPSLGVRLIQAAIDHGYAGLDTAPLYGCGAVEETVGAALRDRAFRAPVATKCGIRWDHEHGATLFSAEVSGTLRAFRVNGLPASIRHEVHASLTRLRVDAIDVVQLHQFDASVPLEDTLGELCSLRREGKLDAIGVSNFPLSALARAARVLASEGGLYSTQDEYNAIERRAESSTLEFAREHGVRFWAYSPLAGGVLSGRFIQSGASEPCAAAVVPLDHRKDSAAFEPENLARINAAVTGAAAPLARRHGVTLAQLGLSWVLSRPGVSAAIVGGSSEEQIRQNAAVLGSKLGSALQPGELDELDRALKAAAPQASRRSLFDRVKAGARRALGKGGG